MNIVSLVGRLTKDPEILTYGKDGLLAKFTVAVNRNAEEADFIYCTAFDKTAEFLEKYFKRGHRIGVIGRIHTDNYEDKEGNTVWSTEVIAVSVDLIETKVEAEAKDKAEAEAKDKEEKGRSRSGSGRNKR